jgi:DNA-binding IclR family transcriptional regulator
MNLSRSTAHRILKCLLDERLIDYSGEGSNRYVIGGLTFELGLAATDRWHKIEEWRPAIDALSRKTGTTVYLMGRTGNESVCLYAGEASSVVRVIPVHVGQRRPLGVGAGATALLAASDPQDIENVLSVIEPYLVSYSTLTADQIRENIAAAEASGFAESRSAVAEGVYGLGVAVPEKQSPATLAISLAAHESIATPENVASWKKQLTEAARSGGKFRSN